MDYILKKYYKFAKLWSLNSKRLIKYVLQDYKIKFKPGITLKFYLIYKLIEIENLALQEFVKENLRKGYIRPLQSLAGYPVLFIPKKNKKLRMCKGTLQTGGYKGVNVEQDRQYKDKSLRR